MEIEECELLRNVRELIKNFDEKLVVEKKCHEKLMREIYKGYEAALMEVLKQNG